MASVRRLIDPRDGTLLDRAVVVRYPGPATATGDDIVELQLHGSVATVEAVEAALATLDGMVAAGPGDFTRRAFANGKLDLSQVEGLADLLAAQTQAQRIAALAIAEGGLRQRVEQWQSVLLGIAARVEAMLDFADEDDVPSDPFDEELAALIASMALVLAAPPAERLHDGFRVVIAGPPNAGKSSLINALVGREAAIVAPVAGTTRDVIEVPLKLGQLPVILSDTAGLNDRTDDPVEAIGISRAAGAIERADLVLWLGPPEDAPLRSIVVQSKADLDPLPVPGLLRLSARTGEGLDDLVNLVEHRLGALVPAAGTLTLTRHQRGQLDIAIESLGRAQCSSDLLLLAEELRGALRSFDKITGSAHVEAMLDALFGRFCIGK